MKRILASLIGAAALIPAVPAATLAAPSLAPAEGWENGRGDPLYEIFVETPDVDPEAHRTYLLALLDVPADEWDDRASNVYEAPADILTGYALRVTIDEAERIDRVLSDDPMGATGWSSPTQIEPMVEGYAPSDTSRGDYLAGESEAPTILDSEIVPLDLRRHLGDADVDDLDSPDAVIAIIDTGTDRSHPDLNVIGGYNCVQRASDVGWYDDYYWHGTATASLAAAERNGVGIVGAAPGAGIYAIKAFYDPGNPSAGYASDASLICAYNAVYHRIQAGERVDAVNMSYGGSGVESHCGERDPQLNALCVLRDLDVALVASAGNSATDSRGFRPANYSLAGVVTAVAAIGDFDGAPGSAGPVPALGCASGSRDDARAIFSNFRADITASGVCTLVAIPTYDLLYDVPIEVPYARGSGTSFSGPKVAGEIARYRDDNPDHSAETAVAQMVAWSEGKGGTYRDIDLPPDVDQEPVLAIGAPRWEPQPGDPPGGES